MACAIREYGFLADSKLYFAVLRVEDIFLAEYAVANESDLIIAGVVINARKACEKAYALTWNIGVVVEYYSVFLRSFVSPQSTKYWNSRK